MKCKYKLVYLPHHFHPVEICNLMMQYVLNITSSLEMLINYMVSVYFSWPEPCAPPTWQLLGHLAEDKPSAIFKISSLKKGPLGSGDVGPNMNTFGGQLFSHNAQIGISVEPILQVQQQSALVTSQTTSNFMQFCQKMLENFLNYASSFGVTQAQMTPNPNETFIPLSVLQSWYNNFERRLQQNPNFWRT